MNTTVDRIRRRLAEAEACQALLRNYPSDAIADRISGLRTALEEAEIAAEEEQEEQAPLPSALDHYLAGIITRSFNRAIPVPPTPKPPAPADAAPPPAVAQDREPDLLPSLRPTVFVGDEAVALDPAAAARLPQPEPAPAAGEEAAPPSTAATDAAPAETAAAEAPPQELDRPKWTAARREKLREMWTSQVPTAEIFDALNALPGLPISRSDVSAYAITGLRLPSRAAMAACGAAEPAPRAPRDATRTHRDWITEERDALFRRLWYDADLTIPQIFAACGKLPGPPLPTGGSSASDWAARLGLPRPRATVVGAGDAAQPPSSSAPPPGASTLPPLASDAPPPEPPGAAPAPPAAAPAEADPERLSHAHRLRAQGHDARSIAKRTGLDLAQVQALEADAKRQAEELLRQGALSTEDIAAECGLPPATIRTLRTSMKGRAA